MQIKTGKDVKEARIELGLSLEFLAKHAGYSCLTISRVERGFKHVPRHLKHYLEALYRRKTYQKAEKDQIA